MAFLIDIIKGLHRYCLHTLHKKRKDYLHIRTEQQRTVCAAYGCKGRIEAGLITDTYGSIYKLHKDYMNILP